MDSESPFLIVTHTIPASFLREYPHAILNEAEDLFLEVKQYIPSPEVYSNTDSLSGPEDAVTIIAAGGVGFIKELYEPLFAKVVQQSAKAGFRIRAIWMADPVNIGASAVRNKANLGCDPHWWDHSHDLWSMIEHFRKEMVSPIMGLAHSAGASQLAYLSRWSPRLFTSLVLIEAGLDSEYGRGIIFPWAKQRLMKQDSWSEKTDAEKDLAKGARFEKWDPQVTANLLKHGLYRDEGSPTAQWKVATPKHQEVGLVFRLNAKSVGVESNDMAGVTLNDRIDVPDIHPGKWNPPPTYRPELQGGWELLSALRPWVLYINGDSSPFFGKPQTREERARITGTGTGGSGGMRLGAVEQVVIEGGRHTMTFDGKMGEVARYAAQWLSKEMERWRDGEKRRRGEWQRMTLDERQKVPSELADFLRGWRPTSKLDSKL